MNTRFVAAILVVSVVLAGLIYSAVGASAKKVVTVDELVQEGSSRHRIRLGARLTNDEISYTSEPSREVRFSVRDVTGAGEVIPVVYQGAMPDTLKTGRDVILEGDFTDGIFFASSLMTQCPSKYKPPVPGQEAKQEGDA